MGLVFGLTVVQEGMVAGAAVGVGAVVSFNLVNWWMGRKSG